MIFDCRNQFECSVHLMNTNDIQPSGDRNPSYIYRHFLIETSYEGHPSETKVEIVIGKALQAQDYNNRQAGSDNFKQNDLYTSDKWSDDTKRYQTQLSNNPLMENMNRNLIDSSNMWPDNSFEDSTEKSIHQNIDMSNIHDADPVTSKKNLLGVTYKIPSTNIYSNNDEDYVEYEEYGIATLKESPRHERRKCNFILEI